MAVWTKALPLTAISLGFKRWFLMALHQVQLASHQSPLGRNMAEKVTKNEFAR